MTTALGNLRTLYSVRTRADTRDGRGERANSWSEKFRIRGERPREGNTSSRGESGSLLSETSYRMRTRFHKDMLIGDQLVNVSDETEVFYVRQATDVDGRRRYLQLVVSRYPDPVT